MTGFADFIAPFDVGTFRAQHCGRHPVHIRREGQARPSILSWTRFNEVLAITPYWNEDSLKLYFKSRAALRENYCDVGNLARGTNAPANPAKVKALLGLGASVVANHLHRVCPEVGEVAAMLGREFAARVFANVYCSFKGVQAFTTHYDLHDVFAVQAEGEKTWRVYEARADAPVSPLPPGDEVEKWLTASRGRLLFEVLMKPGDILYLPRGQYHDALTGSQASLHVTFGVAPATGLALCDLLETALTRESDFRAYLPDARNGGELRDRLAQLAERVQTVITSPTFALDVLNHQRGLSGVTAAFQLPTQSTPSWYSLARKGQIVRRDDGVALEFDGGRIELGATYPTVEWILQQRIFSLEDAVVRQAGVERVEVLGVIEQLAKAGIIIETEMR